MSRTAIRMSRLAVASALAALAVATLPAAADAATHQPATAKPSLAGTWNVQGGIFKFAKNKKGQFVDTVVKQRPGVFCSNVNDKSGQIVLTQQAKKPLEYKGTWKWFISGSCAFVGNGPTTITLSGSGRTAVLVSDAPPGEGSSVEEFTITRIG
jgi:hypothetical protein